MKIMHLVLRSCNSLLPDLTLDHLDVELWVAQWVHHCLHLELPHCLYYLHLVVEVQPSSICIQTCCDLAHHNMNNAWLHHALWFSTSLSMINLSRCLSSCRHCWVCKCTGVTPRIRCARCLPVIHRCCHVMCLRVAFYHVIMCISFKKNSTK